MKTAILSRKCKAVTVTPVNMDCLSNQRETVFDRSALVFSLENEVRGS